MSATDVEAAVVALIKRGKSMKTRSQVITPMGPLVSVVVTTYNQAAYIEETIRSVLAQTYLNREIIVVDDGSPDDTAARLAQFGGSITYVRQENQGVAGARNTGIHHARGELIALLDGDDLWEPDKLTIQVAAYERSPATGMIVVDAYEFSGSETLHQSLLAWTTKDFMGSPSERDVTVNCYRQLLLGNFIATTSQVMVPARVLANVGVSDMSFRVASDYDLYLRITAAHDVTFVKQALVGWRYLRTSVSGPAEYRSARWSEDVIAVLRKHFREARDEWRPLIRKVLDEKIMYAAQIVYYRGAAMDRMWATSYLVRLARKNPSHPGPLLCLLGLWSPRVLTSVLGPRVRRILTRGVSETYPLPTA